MPQYNYIERLARGALRLTCPPMLFRGIRDAYAYLNYLPTSFLRSRAIIHTQVTQKSFKEPSEHFFGYYDKTPWACDGRQVLYHRVSKNAESIDIICYDLESDAPHLVGCSETWNWQQGAMAQWRPSYTDQVIYNNRSASGEFVAEIHSTASGDLVDTIPLPIQTLRSDGQAAISLNYRRLMSLRPDYGYACDAKNFSPDQPDDQDGLFFVDINSREYHLVLSIEQLKKDSVFTKLSNAKHKVNHVIYSPRGNRVAFLHICIHDHGRIERLYVVEDSGKSLVLLLDNRMVSHFTWIDDERLICYCRTPQSGDGYYVINTTTRATDEFAKDSLWESGDGHPSVSPNGRFVITDSYPDRSCSQYLILYHCHKQTQHEVARLYHSLKYRDTRRCDLHPRWSPDGKWISVDTVAFGKREMMLFDVSCLTHESEL